MRNKALDRLEDAIREARLATLYLEKAVKRARSPLHGSNPIPTELGEEALDVAAKLASLAAAIWAEVVRGHEDNSAKALREEFF